MKKSFSNYLCYLLRHHPESLELDMDIEGWVSTEELIQKVDQAGQDHIDLEQLKELVCRDKEGRYRLNEDCSKIKAVFSHSIPWVVPELEYLEPPEFLYHGTTTEALEKIKASGFILKMERHAVHTRAECNKAWQSAKRWGKKAVVLKFASREMYQKGYIFGKTENGIWVVEKVPVEYIVEYIFEREKEK